MERKVSIKLKDGRWCGAVVDSGRDPTVVAFHMVKYDVAADDVVVVEVDGKVIWDKSSDWSVLNYLAHHDATPS